VERYHKSRTSDAVYRCADCGHTSPAWVRICVYCGGMVKKTPTGNAARKGDERGPSSPNHLP
jgi:hypothetical protein